MLFSGYSLLVEDTKGKYFGNLPYTIEIRKIDES